MMGLNFIPQNIKSSYFLRYVSRGCCRTSVNTSVFRKSSVISDDKFQYVGFYNSRGNVVLGKRKLSEKHWKLRITPLQGNMNDAHNSISLGLDGEGYLHIAFGMHGSKLKYAKSIKPHSLKMTPLLPMNGEIEDKVTYPEFHTLSGGDLLFFYRNGVSGNGNMVIKRYKLNERKWITIQANLIDGQGERNAYWQAWVDKNDNIHLSWVWRENPDVASNHDIYYACSKDGGITWLKSNGEKYSLPIIMVNAETAWHIPENSELINQTTMTTDDAGYPYIGTYWRDRNSEIPQYRIVWHNGLKWKMKEVGKRTGQFSLSGKGTKMVPVSRPLILEKSGRFYFIFRDKERGSRVTMAVIGDIEKGPWLFHDLTDFNVDAWEPTFDENLWKKDGRLHLFVQTTHQKDGEKVAY